MLEEVRQCKSLRHLFLPTLLQDRADAASLRLLQVSELLAWISDNKLPTPKSKRKDGTSFNFIPSNRVDVLSYRADREHCEDHGVHTGLQVDDQRHCGEGISISISCFFV